ncbi:hypothetical protein BKA65DRAFT_183573 [Rhexocercosporidium sp. MPI-PUGE-AT-0058]|nr:hypothetical protein BKA65DRAFT_183573 [Rhexocercosporidium sp. MPI-PUGE-AT-0058]
MSSIIPVDDAIAAADGRTFPLFSKLPLELRLMIWKELIPSGRLITIYTDYSTSHKHLTGSAFQRARADPPKDETLKGLSQASHDSRMMIQTTHTLAFRNRLFTPIFFNFERDVLLFKDATAMARFAPLHDTRKLNRKEIENKVKAIILGWEPSARGILGALGLLRFQNLDTLIWENIPGLSTPLFVIARQRQVERLLEQRWKEIQINDKPRTKIENWSIDEAKKRLLLVG